ncbi:MFS transporter [Streptomyces hiroshimensis]|uniref:MFS transporter n=1 Tax=Streptomyces hiroshimensis TaxID=66424 RepID=A0ABQ2Z3J2_9ACTN|nr:MFS transporter [Streptomyces hiroshimensis]GGY03919.1 MFS transporter [Streptomyces hiroshimensis]
MPATLSPAPSPHGTRSRGVPWAMLTAVLVAQSLVAAINLAIPLISASPLHPSPSQLLWIVDTYVIVFAGLLVPAGALGDRFGSKGALLSGLALFAAGTALCALAPNVPLLLAGRGISGAGAALVMPATMSLLLYVTEPRRHGGAIASWSAAVAMGGLLGNTGGALILQYLPWQGLFWAYVPLGVVLLAWAARVAPRPPRGGAALDVPGSGLLMAGLLALLYGIIEGPSHGWSSPLVLGAFALASLMLAAFAGHGLRTAHPVLDPRLFRLPAVSSGTLGLAATFFGMFALFFVNAQFLQYVKGFSPLEAGLGVLPVAVGIMVFTRRSLAWAARLGRIRTVTAGLLLIAAGLAALSTADAGTPYPLYALWLLVMALGCGAAMPSLSGAVVTALPQEKAGVGSGLNAAARELGAALGIAVVGTALSVRFSARLPQGAADGSPAQALQAARGPGGAVHTEVLSAYTDAVSLAYRVAAVVIVVLAAAVAAGLRRERRS